MVRSPPNLFILKNYCFHFSKFSIYTLIVHYVINFVFSIGKQPYRDVINFVSYIYRGVCRIFQGGGPTLKFLGFWIYMSRAAKLRAFARGVWGHAPPRKFKKMVQFRVFSGLFSTTFMVKNPLKIL